MMMPDDDETKNDSKIREALERLRLLKEQRKCLPALPEWAPEPDSGHLSGDGNNLLAYDPDEDQKEDDSEVTDDKP